MILKRLFGGQKADPSADLYAAIVAAARQEKFYAEWRVPDTMDGRFDMMVLHMFLVLDRLRAFAPDSDNLRQELTDKFFAEMDAALREAGVGDLSVGKKVRKMAEAFFGRVAAYSAAMQKGQATLQLALQRNIYVESDASRISDLATWTMNAQDVLAKQDYDAIAKGHVRFE